MNKRLYRLLCLPLLIMVLCGCGPKDIGTGTTDDAPQDPAGISTADQLRYPITGMSNTQRMLYLNNRPGTMQQMQYLRMDQIRRMHGLDDAVDPSDPTYRAVPKQRSPFRQ